MKEQDEKQANPTAGIIFGGFGLSSYAIEQERFDIKFNIEYKDIAAEVYRLNHPGVHVFEQSSRSLTAQKICDKLGIMPGDIDFAQNSFPCPDISSVSVQEMFAEGNDQFFVSTKILLDLKVKVILYENVPALSHENMAVLLGMMIAMLKKYASEYTVQAMELNAHLFGDGQARPRVYIMLVHQSVGSPRWPDPIPKSQRKFIRDLYPEARYIISRNYGERQYLPHEPLPTITGHPDLKMYDDQEYRALTNPELARGMGLPETYILKGSISDQSLGLGNGMCVEVTRAIVRVIRQMLTESPKPGAPVETSPVAAKAESGAGVVIYQGPSQNDGQATKEPAIDAREFDAVRQPAPVRNICLTDVNHKRIESRKIISSRELAEMQFESLNFSDDWSEFMGFPSLNFCCVIHGMSGHGKSTFAVQFAKYLGENFGKVVFISGEEGFNSTFKDKLLSNDAVSSFVDIADLSTYDEVVSEVRSGRYNFIFIDSLDTMKIGPVQMKQLREIHKDSAFVTISQNTKSGQMRGSYELVHDCDIAIEVNKGIAVTIKNRFKPIGEFFRVFERDIEPTLEPEIPPQQDHHGNKIRPENHR